MEDQDQVAPRRRLHRRPTKLIVGATIVIAALIGLVTWAMARPQSTSFYVTPSEVVALGDRASTHDYRVNGTVVPGSISHHGVTTKFEITDGKTPVGVTTKAPLPDTFKKGATVVAQGPLVRGDIKASQVLAKCPSKFKPKSS